MAIVVNIKNTCYRCHGDGTLGNNENRVCSRCEGAGVEVMGTFDLEELETKLKTKLNTMRDQILDAIAGE